MTESFPRRVELRGGVDEEAEGEAATEGEAEAREGRLEGEGEAELALPAAVICPLPDEPACETTLVPADISRTSSIAFN